MTDKQKTYLFVRGFVGGFGSSAALIGAILVIAGVSLYGFDVLWRFLREYLRLSAGSSAGIVIAVFLCLVTGIREGENQIKKAKKKEKTVHEL